MWNGQSQHYTNRCITLWYRPPELLLGAKQYGPAVDLWSVGCVFGEMLMKRPILPGKDEADQFDLICKLCGTPEEQSWPNVSQLDFFNKFVTHSPRPKHSRVLVEKLGGLVGDKIALGLLDRLLTLDPKNRITANEALFHDYFWSDPMPAEPKDLPTYKSSHEFNRKKKQMQPNRGGGSSGQQGHRGPPTASALSRAGMLGAHGMGAQVKRQRPGDGHAPVSSTSRSAGGAGVGQSYAPGTGGVYRPSHGAPQGQPPTKQQRTG